MSYVISAIVIILLLQILAYVALRFLHRKKDVYYLPRKKPVLSKRTLDFVQRLVDNDGKGAIKAFHPVLGWHNRPNSISADGLYHINAAGARGKQEYKKLPAPGHRRIVAFGDCLTFGEKVPDEHTWPGLFRILLPNCEVLNFGVEGYGPGQSYLQYRESLKVYPQQDIVVIAFVSSNIFKPLNLFRPFYAYDHGLQLAKPAFELQGEQLTVIDNPLSSLQKYQELLDKPDQVLSSLARRDFYHCTSYSANALDLFAPVRLGNMILGEYRKRRMVFAANGRLKSDSLAYEITREILYRHYSESLANGAKEAILLFLPLEKEVRQYMKNGLVPWEPLADDLARSGCRILDMLPILGQNLQAAKYRMIDLFQGRNYSALCNRQISESLHQVLFDQDNSAKKASFSTANDHQAVE